MTRSRSTGAETTHTKMTGETGVRQQPFEMDAEHFGSPPESVSECLHRFPAEARITNPT